MPPSSEAKRAAQRGGVSLQKALCALAEQGLLSLSVLRDPAAWPSKLAEQVQDAFMGLSLGQGDVERAALTAALHLMGKAQLLTDTDGKRGPPLKKLWRALSTDQPPADVIRLREFRLYAAGLAERFIVARVGGTSGKGSIKQTAALKSQIQLRAILGVPPHDIHGKTVRVDELVALLKDAGAEVPASCAAALVKRLAKPSSEATRHRPRGMLQGVDIDEESDRSVAEQLREALSKNALRVIDLFHQWDENHDGAVSKKEFRRAMPMIGFDVPRAEVDALFDSWDRDGSGTIELGELTKFLKRGATGGDGELRPSGGAPAPERPPREQPPLPYAHVERALISCLSEAALHQVRAPRRARARARARARHGTAHAHTRTRAHTDDRHSCPSAHTTICCCAREKREKHKHTILRLLLALCLTRSCCGAAPRPRWASPSRR